MWPSPVGAVLRVLMVDIGSRFGLSSSNFAHNMPLDESADIRHVERLKLKHIHLASPS